MALVQFCPPLHGCFLIKGLKRHAWVLNDLPGTELLWEKPRPESLPPPGHSLPWDGARCPLPPHPALRTGGGKRPREIRSACPRSGKEPLAGAGGHSSPNLRTPLPDPSPECLCPSHSTAQPGQTSQGSKRAQERPAKQPPGLALRGGYNLSHLPERCSLSLPLLLRALGLPNRAGRLQMQGRQRKRLPGSM